MPQKLPHQSRRSSSRLRSLSDLSTSSRWQDNDFGGTKRYINIHLVPTNSFGPPTMVAVVADFKDRVRRSVPLSPGRSGHVSSSFWSNASSLFGCSECVLWTYLSVSFYCLKVISPNQSDQMPQSSRIALLGCSLNVFIIVFLSDPGIPGVRSMDPSVWN